MELDFNNGLYDNPQRLILPKLQQSRHTPYMWGQVVFEVISSETFTAPKSPMTDLRKKETALPSLVLPVILPNTIKSHGLFSCFKSCLRKKILVLSPGTVSSHMFYQPILTRTYFIIKLGSGCFLIILYQKPPITRKNSKVLQTLVVVHKCLKPTNSYTVVNAKKKKFFFK